METRKAFPHWAECQLQSGRGPLHQPKSFWSCWGRFPSDREHFCSLMSRPARLRNSADQSVASFTHSTNDHFTTSSSLLLIIHKRLRALRWCERRRWQQQPELFCSWKRRSWTAPLPPGFHFLIWPRYIWLIKFSVKRLLCVSMAACQALHTHTCRPTCPFMHTNTLGCVCTSV